MEAASTATTTGSRTMADMLSLAVERNPDLVAVRHKQDGAWHDVTLAEVGQITSERCRGTTIAMTAFSVQGVEVL